MLLQFFCFQELLGGLECSDHKRCKGSLQWKEGKKVGTPAWRSYQVTISFSELGVCGIGRVPLKYVGKSEVELLSGEALPNLTEFFLVFGAYC